jgi:outer membrane receptor protein involved in Fe transport
LTTDGFVTDLQTNVGGVKTKGIDLNASYAMEIGKYGSLNFSLVGTYLDKFVTDNGISTPYDCAGYFGAQCGTPAPKWRHKARVTYVSPIGATLSFQWRYFDPVKVDSSSPNPTLATAFSPFGARIPAQSYFDLASTFKFADHYELRLGVNNVMDKRPPLINSNGALSNCGAVFCNGGTYPAVYDALGRYIYAAVSLNF